MSGFLPFRSDIQGLRAIAVLSVVAYHAGATGLKGGFVGVDIFFVISGFLITKILLKENAAGTYSLTGFYQRRLRRLMPALIVVLTASLIAGMFLLSAGDMRKLGITSAATMLFSSNVIFYLTSDYFGSAAEYHPLLHTWSLAVEEQFYIVFPLFLALVWKRWRSMLVPALLVLVALSLAASVVGGMMSQPWSFYLPFSRAYELLLGALVAARPDLLSRVGQAGRNALSLLGLALIGVSLLLIDAETMLFPGYIALAPCIGTVLVIAAGQSTETLGGKLISGPPFLFFGNLSYSLYLWHWPVLVFAKHYNNGPLTLGTASILMVGAVALAWLTYVGVEKRFIRGFPSLPVLRLGVATIACFAAVGGLIAVTGGLEQRFSAQAHELANADRDFNPERKRCHFGGGTVRSYQSSCVLGGAGASVAVWGDSHGAELAYTLGDQLAARGAGIREITTSACPPVMGYYSIKRPNCAEQNIASLEGLTADPAIRTVIMVAALEGYGADRQDMIESGLKQSVQALEVAGKKVILIGPIPNQDYDPPAALSLRADNVEALSSWGRSRDDVELHLRNYRVMVSEISATTGATVVDPVPVLCNTDLCPGYDPNFGVLYFNQSHLSIAGARKLSAAIIPQLLPALEAN
ncbi:hypothetical protein CXZ10_10805 [Pleomorphomonas diazotrophica]|uniref:Acyltransferase n=1 Tax=Pleomorphomonas diazotrophica TaxID=1166257 RepID=A0A1I4UIP0_9HYPH|nr:acyltransferase family protein [Pleomorphomonas diazotrophica]PKR89165.1 hypothetical protein CXZ10_10805 [Pleomorphomonas diazotrophica]SFM88610.1 Peptidoglycan/LPS O-acetylase OafA/YrhL, contains acyltransferase and SGNH-hydrolase domains [Pleomorphomonas diazotrophica]